MTINAETIERRSANPSAPARTAETERHAPDAAPSFDRTHAPAIEWRPLADLTAITAPWRALGPDVSALLVWSDARKHRLLGLFPMRAANFRSGFLLPVTLGWTHPFAPLGVPLVDRDEAAATIGVWLDFIAQAAFLPSRLLLPFVPTQGAFAHALSIAIQRCGAGSAFFAAHRRAMLEPAQDRATYLENALSAKKRKELARQRRRLGDAGTIATSFAADPQEVGVALDAFMMLEQRGWKGRGGSAAAQDAAATAFMQRAVTDLARTRQACVVQLCAGARPLAAGIMLRSGDTGWFWKIAYDEDAARGSPGVQLAVDLTQAALDDATLARVDSCATAGHPMIEHLWRERLALADRLIVLGSSFGLSRHAEQFRRTVLSQAKSARALFRPHR